MEMKNVHINISSSPVAEQEVSLFG
jgi:hypothetical protein